MLIPRRYKRNTRMTNCTENQHKSDVCFKSSTAFIMLTSPSHQLPGSQQALHRKWIREGSPPQENRQIIHFWWISVLPAAIISWKASLPAANCTETGFFLAVVLLLLLRLSIVINSTKHWGPWTIYF